MILLIQTALNYIGFDLVVVKVFPFDVIQFRIAALKIFHDKPLTAQGKKISSCLLLFPCKFWIYLIGLFVWS